MGWGRMMLLGNVGQQLDIDDINSAVGQMQDAFARTQDLDRSQEQSIKQLQAENRELKLYLTTLVRLLVGKGVVRQEEIDAAVQAVEKSGG